MDACRLTTINSADAQTYKDASVPPIPYASGDMQPTATQLHPGTVQPGSFVGHVILSGPDNWYCTLLRIHEHESMMPDYPVHLQGSSAGVYSLDEVRCQICDKVKDIHEFSENGKKRVQRRATRALNNNGSYEASSKRICCDTCVKGIPSASAKTQLINMATKKQIKAKVTLLVQAMDMSDDTKRIDVEDSFIVGGSIREKDVQNAVYKKLLDQLISRMDED